MDPWSDEVVIGVTDSAPVVELASKESLSLAMASALSRVSGDTTADNPCKGSKLMVVRNLPYWISFKGAQLGGPCVTEECTILFTAKQNDLRVLKDHWS